MIATPARLCPSASCAQPPQQAQPPSCHTTPLLLLAAAGRRLSAAACKAGALAWPAAFAVAHALQPPCLLHAEHTKRPTLAAANIIRSVQRWLLTPLLHAAVASTPAALPVLLLWAVAWWPPALLLASRPAARRADSIPECPGHTPIMPPCCAGCMSPSAAVPQTQGMGMATPTTTDPHTPGRVVKLAHTRTLNLPPHAVLADALPYSCSMCKETGTRVHMC
jgi:hypothetical protein